MPTRNRRSRKRVEARAEEGLGLYRSADLLRLMTEAAEAALEAEAPSGTGEVTLLLTTSEALRELNRRFNGEDAVTDVLAFNETAGWHNGRPPEQDGEFPSDSGRLGDIVISVQMATGQAASAGHSLAQELAVLTVHGTLHLLGYDHATPDEERAMFDKTDRIVAAVMPPGRRAGPATGIATSPRPLRPDTA
jgi:probable rRNA maturation factor